MANSPRHPTPDGRPDDVHGRQENVQHPQTGIRGLGAGNQEGRRKRPRYKNKTDAFTAEISSAHPLRNGPRGREGRVVMWGFMLQTDGKKSPNPVATSRRFSGHFYFLSFHLRIFSPSRSTEHKHWKISSSYFDCLKKRLFFAPML